MSRAAFTLFCAVLLGSGVFGEIRPPDVTKPPAGAADESILHPQPRGSVMGPSLPIGEQGLEELGSAGWVLLDPSARADLARDDRLNDVGGIVAVLRGDANCDGSVNNFDIDYFVQALLGNQAAYLALGDQSATHTPQQCFNLRNYWGDLLHDNTLNNFDLDPFVACILVAPAAGSGCP